MAGSVHGATAEVAGRDIRVSGLADGPEEAASLIAALDALPGRRVITSDLTILEKAAPFTLDVAKDGTAMTASGHVPTETLRAELAGVLGDAAGGLKLAAGAPEGWADLAKAGLAALGPLGKGTMNLTDGALKISGQATGPDEAAAVDAALAALPAGSVTKDITLLDDGTPADYTLDYNASTGATIAGKLPKGLDVTAIAKAMGLGAMAGDVKQAILGAMGDDTPFAAFKDWMSQIETLKVAMTPEAGKVDIGVLAGVDGSAMQTAISAAMPGIEVSVATVAAEGANGALRTNAATGLPERLMGGFWLAVPQIDVGLQGCQTAADGVLAGETITFLSGSDELDASAVRVINMLGSIMARCAEEAALKAVIGGHTDSVGDATANLGLSQRRAIAVRRELIARGVPAAALKSVGYGAEQPVGENDTEEGRAKNRRTTIVWSE
jgi:OOP family OmpA-OmpF porin